MTGPTHPRSNPRFLNKGKNLALFNQTGKEPQRYAKYSSDPLLGIKTYPLGFHLIVLGFSEIPLRIMLRNRGFERRCVGPVIYYFHPGADDEDADFRGEDESKMIPIVFVHGIGIGNIMYMALIDYLLKTGRPILLPEIPYVSGFRPWQNPSSVLSPAVVASTVSSVEIATHIFLGDTNPHSAVLAADDCHVGNPRIFARSVCRPLVRHQLVELYVQICANRCCSTSISGSYLLLLALFSIDQKLRVSPPRPWNERVHGTDRYDCELDDSKSIPLGLDISICGTNQGALYRILE